MQAGLIVRWSRAGAWLCSTVASHEPLWLAFTPGDATATAELVADAASRFVSEHGLKSKRVVLCAGPDVSYFVQLKKDSLVVEPTHQSLRFAVESVLPVDAETIELDYVLKDDLVCCVTIDAECFAPLVDALEQNGLQVQHVVSETLLCVQYALAKREFAETAQLSIPVDFTDDFAADVSGRADQSPLQWHELVTLLDGVPVAWGLCAAQGDAMQQELQLQSALVPEDTEGLTTTLNRAASLRSAVSDLLGGRLKPWFELRRGKLAAHDPFRAARSSFDTFVLISSLAIATACGALWYKTTQHDDLAANASESMRTVFTETFPGKRTPSAIVKRMESEHRKVIGQRGSSIEVAETVDAGAILLPLIAALPDSQDPAADELIVESVRINDGQFLLNLLLADYQAAGAVSRSLEEAGFAVDPPSGARAAGGKIRTELRGYWAPKNQVVP